MFLSSLSLSFSLFYSVFTDFRIFLSFKRCSLYSYHICFPAFCCIFHETKLFRYENEIGIFLWKKIDIKREEWRRRGGGGGKEISSNNSKTHYLNTIIFCIYSLSIKCNRNDGFSVLVAAITHHTPHVHSIFWTLNRKYNNNLMCKALNSACGGYMVERCGGKKKREEERSGEVLSSSTEIRDEMQRVSAMERGRKRSK